MQRRNYRLQGIQLSVSGLGARGLGNDDEPFGASWLIPPARVPNPRFSESFPQGSRCRAASTGGRPLDRCSRLPVFLILEIVD